VVSKPEAAPLEFSEINDCTVYTAGKEKNGNLLIASSNDGLEAAATVGSKFRCFKGLETYHQDASLFIFARENMFRRVCVKITSTKWFDYIILLFIAFNCITLAMERPNIPPQSFVRIILHVN